MFVEFYVDGFEGNNPILVDVSKASKYMKMFKSNGKKYTVGKFIP